MASSELYNKVMDAMSGFPLLGFPNENNRRAGEVVYQAFWWGVRIAVWARHKGLTQQGKYGVNLYLAHYTNDTVTHVQDRYSVNQGPILVDDAFEAQLAINHLIQKHLPQELIDDIYRGHEVQSPDCSGNVSTCSSRAGCETGETVE